MVTVVAATVVVLMIERTVVCRVTCAGFESGGTVTKTVVTSTAQVASPLLLWRSVSRGSRRQARKGGTEGWGSLHKRAEHRSD